MRSARLGDVCDMRSGGTPRRGVGAYYGGPIPWVTIADMTASDGVVRKTAESLTEAGLAAIGNRVFEPGTVLLAMYGSVGKLAVAGSRVATNQAILGLRPRENALDARYLMRWLGSIQAKLVNDARGVTQANISKSLVEELTIPLPLPEEQRRIADILDKADAIRRKRKEAIALTEELLRSTFLEMFGDPVTNPKGWPTDTIGNLLSLRSGEFLPAKQMDSSGPYAVYGGNGINGRHSAFMFEEPMITIGRVGVYCGAMHRTEPRSWVTDNALYVAEYRKDLHISYLENALRIANLNQYSSQAAQPLISGGRIAPVRLLVPSEGAQLSFARFIDAHAATVSTLRDASIASETLFEGLVARAFSGTLEATR